MWGFCRCQAVILGAQDSKVILIKKKKETPFLAVERLLARPASHRQSEGKRGLGAD